MHRPTMPRRLWGVVLGTLVAVLVVAGCSGGSDNTLDQIESDGVITVGTEGTYPPFTYHDRSGDLTGFDVEVTRKIADSMGVEAKFTETQFDAIFAGLTSKRYDVIANQITKNPEREAEYALSDPYIVSEGVIVTRAGDDSIKNLDDIKGKTAAQSSTSNWADVAKEAGAKVEAVEGFTPAVALLEQGRVDVIINDNLAVLDYLQQNPDAKVKIAGKAGGEKSEQVFAFRKEDTELRDEFNDRIAEMKENGDLDAIYGTYFGEDATSDRSQTTSASNWQLIKENAWPMLKRLVLATIPLTALSFTIGLALALVVALMRMSPIAPLAWAARAFISVVRGTPLLVQLFVIFFGLPEIGIKLEPFTAAVIAFSINVAGYAAEIIRAAILSVPKGQWEAAQTIGMDYRTTLRRVILPQAMRTAVPPLSNTLISLVKDTSLASIILVTEMFRVAQVAASANFKYLGLYAFAALYYWIVCLVLTFFQERLEKRLDRHVAR